MRDEIILLIDNKPFADFLSFTADSDLFQAADAWNAVISDDKNEIGVGQCVELYVNKSKELVGIVDRVKSRATKKGRVLEISGRDLMGMLCNHDITEYGADVDLGGKTLGTIAKTVMRSIPFISPLLDIVYDGNAERIAVPYDTLKAEPGQSAFDLLKTVATGRGLHFWCREDGKFVFGKPIVSGPASYRFILSRSGASTNVLEGEKTADLNDAFSKVFVYGQSGDDDDSNVEATATLSVPGEFPFYRPKVVQVNTDKISPRFEAKRQINMSKAKMLRLSYIVPGFAQNGTVFRTNTIARVDDDINNVHGDHLVYGRTMNFTGKKDGMNTTVRLCLPGALIDA